MVRTSRYLYVVLASAVVVFIAPIFVMLRDNLPVVAALHPVAAVLAFPLSLVVALNSLRALRDGRAQEVRAGSP